MKYTNAHIHKMIDRKIYKDSNGCQIWMGSLAQGGRPKITFGRSSNTEKMLMVFPHIFLYEEKHGKLNVRYLDSNCDNDRCINPDHQSPRTFEKRLLSNYVKDENSCWMWQGHVMSNGYGALTVEGKSKMVHRLSYEYHIGEIPKGLMVCHKCNVKLCLNPDHLYVGTHNDNMQDMADSASLKGEKNPKSLLTEAQVLGIKQHIKDRKIFYKDIAKMYGVSRQAIKDIASGRTWGWL